MCAISCLSRRSVTRNVTLGAEMTPQRAFPRETRGCRHVLNARASHRRCKLPHLLQDSQQGKVGRLDLYVNRKFTLLRSELRARSSVDFRPPLQTLAANEGLPSKIVHHAKREKLLWGMPPRVSGDRKRHLRPCRLVIRGSQPAKMTFTCSNG